MNECGQPPNTGAGRGFDRVLAALGLALLVAAMIWLALLVRESGGGASSALQVSAETLVPEHAGSESVLEDEAFGVVLPGRALRRVVQMLQWREVASVPLAVDDEVVADQGDYQLVWSEKLIDSSVFEQAQGHVNPPPPPYRSRSLGTAPAWNDAGADAWHAVPPDHVVLPENLAAVFRAEGKWLLTAPPGDLPAPGDLRVRFEVLPDVASAAPAGLDEAPSDAALAGAQDEALRWIARAAAFITALLGAGLALRGFSRLSQPSSALGRLRSGALLAISAWLAVGAMLLAAVIAHVG